MAHFKTIVGLLALLAAIHVNHVHGKRNASEIIRRISRFSNKMVRPNDWSDKPTVVNVSLYISNFHAVDETRMEFSMDMFYRRMWNDPRLQYEDGPDHVKINPDVVTDWFWVPDLFFPNAREIQTHEVLRDSVGAWVKPTGDVKLSAKLSIRLHCPMDLGGFPMDVQKCPLKIESYMHGKDHIELRWDSLKVSEEANPPAFNLLHVEKSTETIQLSIPYHSLIAYFTVRRQSGHYLLTMFLPSAMIVLLSCLLYWLPLWALSERTFFSAFLFLSMIMLLAASQQGVPQVGYAKSIDVWVVSCLMFLFFNVLEVIVLYLLARSSGYRGQSDQLVLINNEENKVAGSATGSEPDISFLSVNLVRRVDWVLRIVYPCAFLLFNIIFWSASAN